MIISPTALALLLLGSSTTSSSWSMTFGAARAQDPAEYHVEIRDGQFVAGCNPFKVAGYNGWELVEARGVAAGQVAAKSFARSIRADRCEPWAVLGEQPLEDERSACGCTNIVFDGVRMQLPEMVFGLSPAINASFGAECKTAPNKIHTRILLK